MNERRCGSRLDGRQRAIGADQLQRRRRQQCGWMLWLFAIDTSDRHRAAVSEGKVQSNAKKKNAGPRGRAEERRLQRLRLRRRWPCCPMDELRSKLATRRLSAHAIVSFPLCLHLALAECRGSLQHRLSCVPRSCE